MTYRLSAASRGKLAGLHPDIVAVVERAIEITPSDFTVLEGMRTIARQKQLVARGASKTMNSRHLTGHAVDLAPFVDTDSDGKPQISWSWPDYYPLAAAVKRAAADLGVPIEWGGDWSKFKDGPHWQLPWKTYPVGDMRPRFRNVALPAPEVEQAEVAVSSAEPITEKSDTQVATEKSVAIGGAGGAGAITVAVEPLAKVTEVVTGQQADLSSGDLVRMAIAGFIVALTLYGIWRTWR